MPITQATRNIAVSSPLGDDVLVLRQMSATEQLGRLFEFELELLSEEPAVAFESMVGENMTVRLGLPSGETRYLNGYVSAFSQASSAEEEHYVAYRATLRPWLWFLTRTADCRIFQEKTAPEIINQIFSDHGFSGYVEEALSGSYRTWPYCVQYRETDFNFVSRLMEQEGIYYFFKHENGKHTLVLCDSYSAHEPFPGYEDIPFYPPGEDQRRERDHIYDWMLSQELQPGACALNDFNFETPKASLRSMGAIDRPHAQSQFEIYDYPGEYTDSGEGDSYARIRIEELQSEFEQVQGSGNAMGVAAGWLFTLGNFPRADQNREYLVLSTSLDVESDVFESGGTAAGPDFTCSFTALDASQPYRSERITPKPVVQGPQTAIVVGKKGEELWTDEYGRVKVQFHWDRYGKADEDSSCWIRVAQLWAGKHWGAMYMPRIGQEVIVEFLEGDPDRPIITGRVYNDTTKPPYELPANATMSALKSNSSKGGGGFNEIRLEDKKGEEQLFIHGEKNFDLRVKNDRFETVGTDGEGSRHLVVEKDKKEHVKNDRHELVDNHHQEKIGGDRNLKVVGKQAVAIEKSLSLTVTEDVIEVFKANHSEQVTNDYYVKGTNLVIEGTTNVTVKVGQSYIAIEAGGIKIGTTGTLELESVGQLSAKGTAGAKVESPAQVEVKGTMTSVKGSAMVDVQGGLVKIN